jgi:two-component system, sensor histidine kinase LadS
MVFTLVPLVAHPATLLAAADEIEPPAPLVLTGPAEAAVLGPHFEYIIDEAWQLSTTDFIGAQSVEMLPLAGAIPDFGYTAARIWLRLKLVNDTPRTADWLYFVHANFMPSMQIHQIAANGSVATVMDMPPDSPFDARPIIYPQVVAPFELAPGEAATLLMAYSSQGSSRLSMSIETPESFAAMSLAASARTYLFYGMIFVLIAVTSIAIAVFRQRLLVIYAAYVVSLFLYIAHVDGAAFQYLWPNWPGFNAMASVVAGSGVMVFGGLFAITYLQTRRRHPVMHVVLVTVIVAVLALDIVLWATNPQLLKQLLVIMISVSALTFLVAAVNAARTRFHEVRFYVFAWLACLIPASLFTLRHIFGLELSFVSLYDTVRAGLIFDAYMMGLATFDQLRQSRERAIADSLTQARRNLALGERLAVLEGRYEEAVDQARRREESVKDAVHDLRQPMHALRLSLRRSFSGGASGAADAGQIESALGYMERLVAERLAEQEARETGPPSDAANHARRNGAAGEPGLHDVMRGVVEMFSPEAEAKGLSLRLRLIAADMQVDAYAAMRVLANLVSNAIKYTRQGRILIAMRRSGDDIRIEVHDTGPGLRGAEFEQARGRGERLERDRMNTEGSGKGLAIVTEIAQAKGWRVFSCEHRRAGSSICVVVPSCPERSVADPQLAHEA